MSPIPVPLSDLAEQYPDWEFHLGWTGPQSAVPVWWARLRGTGRKLEAATTRELAMQLWHAAAEIGNGRKP